jgi:hypothetical protein
LLPAGAVLFARRAVPAGEGLAEAVGGMAGVGVVVGIDAEPGGAAVRAHEDGAEVRHGKACQRWSGIAIAPWWRGDSASSSMAAATVARLTPAGKIRRG